jgi:molybdopterin-containing oxidoreductase family membrane subunit
MFHPTFVDVLTFVGSCGIFLTQFQLFLRFLPVFPIAEVKAETPQADPHGHDEEAH